MANRQDEKISVRTLTRLPNNRLYVEEEIVALSVPEMKYRLLELCVLHTKKSRKILVLNILNNWSLNAY